QISNLDIPLGVNDGSEIVVIPKTNADGEPTIGGLSSARILTLSPDKTYDVIDFSDTEVGIKTDLGMVGCASKTAPCINVLSPNGGETYSPGQSVTVKWRTQGLTPSALVGISLRTMNNNLPYAIQGYDYHINDGEETITLPDPVILPNGYTANDKFAISLQAYEPTGSGAVIATDQSDGVFTIADSTSKPTSCGKSVSNTKDLPYNSAGVSFQFFPDSSVSTAEIGTKDVDIGDGFFVNGKGCLTELSLDFYSGWEGTVLEGAVYLINKDGDVLATTKLNNYSQATFKDINFELNGQDTLFVSVDLANEFSQKGLIHTLNQHVTIMGYKYIRSDHDTIYNVKDGVNRLGTVIVYDDVEPQTLPISHLYIKNTTSAKSVAASSKRNTKIATFDMQGYLGARPGNIAFQIGSDSSTPNLKNSIYFINTKTGDRAKMSNVGAYYTFDFSEVRHEWDTMQTYALYVNKPKDTSARAKTYPVSYLGVQEANNMDNYQSDTMFLKLTLKK
ncbi:MAG: hypothetical protein QG594_1813, partial [Bacteroidota bacterium]|nr:hypothetical protein [Bacteroidota bacterium]